MISLNFTKMHGLGNDFVVLNFSQKKVALTSAQIKFLADRKYGIGCDQVLLIEEATSDDTDFIYRIFNADGSEAGHCGNGARCIIQYLISHNISANKNIHLRITNQIITGKQNPDSSITIAMKAPRFEVDAIPFKHIQIKDNNYRLHIGEQIIECGVASVGNPHVMLKLSNLDELDNTAHLTHIAQIIQKSNYFPNGVNVNFYVVISDKHLRLRTFERGCGFTQACGTGATATACYAIQQQQAQKSVVVEMLGGRLNIEWDGVNKILMTGPATEVFQGQIQICI